MYNVPTIDRPYIVENKFKIIIKLNHFPSILVDYYNFLFSSK